MSRKHLVSALQAAMLVALLGRPAPLDAAEFAYEGRLDDRGAPASGRYDIRLVVYRDAEFGAALAAPMTFPSVEVIEGRFRLQFEAPLAGTEPAWVELAVRDAGAKDFSVIPARTKAVLAPATIGTCWSTTGDAGSVAGVNFLGTTDAQPLELRTGNVRSLRIEPSAVLSNGNPITASVIAGSRFNSNFGARGATISGGGAQQDADPDFQFVAFNRVVDHYGTIGGGAGNQAGDAQGTQLDGAFATVSGGASNLAAGYASWIGGGSSNNTDGDYAAISGGYVNQANGTRAAIAGGEQNRAFGSYSAVLGGSSNAATGANAAVAGGAANCAGGNYSWAGGRRAKVRPGVAPNLLTACDNLPSYPGGSGDSGSFVWADSQDANFISTGSDQFMIRAQGGVGINTAPIAAAELSVYGSNAGAGDVNIFLRQPDPAYGGVLVSVGDSNVDSNDAALYIDQYKPSGANAGLLRSMELDTSGRLRVYVDDPISPTGGSWAVPSDARLKHHVAPLEGSLDRLLALHGVSFEYNADAPSGYFVPGVHAGFVAQDVERVFPEWVSTDAGGYRLVGPKGFEALAVEALRELRDDGSAKAQELVALKAEADALREQLAELRARFDSLGTKER